ncbi:MAG: YciI family protein [Pseudomonadota bacterium]
MQYMMMFAEDANAFAEREDPERTEAYWAAWQDYVQTLQQSGVVVNGAGLTPPHAATTVRVRDGKRVVHDGPYADSKEQLGGYFIIDVDDLDAALTWAACSPAAAYGAVEVRPVLPPPPDAP